jgi:hypothetical protein
VSLLALGTHLDTLRPLRALGRGNALLVLDLRRGKSAAAAMATTSATESLHTLSATAATAVTAAAGCLRLLMTAATAAALNLSLAVFAAAVAPGPRSGRGCDR